jgi:hypothetical protein
MPKLDSMPTYPITLVAKGIPTPFVINKTNDGKFQIARILKGGGANEADFDVLFTGADQQSAKDFWLEQVRKEMPGLL